MEKEVATTKKITGELIGGCFLYGIIFGLAYFIVGGFINIRGENEYIFRTIVSIILQGIALVLTWQFSTASAFKRKTLDYNDIPIVMRNLLIFVIIICIISSILNFINIKSNLNELDLQSRFFDTQTDEIKTQLYICTAISEIGSWVINLVALLLEKKWILKYNV